MKKYIDSYRPKQQERFKTLCILGWNDGIHIDYKRRTRNTPIHKGRVYDLGIIEMKIYVNLVWAREMDVFKPYQS